MVEGLLDLASAFGLSTSAGLNAYIPMLTVAVLAKFTHLIVWVILLALTIFMVVRWHRRRRQERAGVAL